MIFILYYLLHMKMKKLLVGAFLGMFALAWTAAVLPNYANADVVEQPWATGGSGQWDNPTWTDMWRDKAQTWSELLTTVKRTINWLLWILATIAVAICLYAWFMMVTSAGDEKKYQKWLTVLKYAAIGLAIVWLSWLIVSAIFWFIKLNTNNNGTTVWA